jgi:hypothetical protein
MLYHLHVAIWAQDTVVLHRLALSPPPCPEVGGVHRHGCRKGLARLSHLAATAAVGVRGLRPLRLPQVSSLGVCGLGPLRVPQKTPATIEAISGLRHLGLPRVAAAIRTRGSTDPRSVDKILQQRDGAISEPTSQ